ncbi:MAG: FAD-dependent oxidoreductase, partial [Phycisphaerae bacterium]|nr:FAD-dependent oxidoreductase [Phycisphaerae bacterium]
ASQTMQDRVLSNDKIEIVWNSVVSDVLGEKMIESVELEDTKTGEHSRLDLTGLFVAIGHTPATSFLEGSGVALDEAGYVLVEGASCQTNVDGVFAAGDVADATYRQAITAAGMGCRAAIDAEHWIANQG